MAASVTSSPNFETLDPDVRLMLQVRDDSGTAFEELVLRYQNRLITVLEHLVNNRQAAEDLAQEVFLRVYRARKSYSPDARFATWLFTIAHNVASNALRAQGRRREHMIASRVGDDSAAMTLDQLAKAASGQMPARQLDKLEVSEVVRLAIDSLNDQQRMALLLSKFEEMSYADIAESMNLSIPAVKSLLWRARENLRTVLEPYMKEGQRPDPNRASVAPPSDPDES